MKVRIYTSKGGFMLLRSRKTFLFIGTTIALLLLAAGIITFNGAVKTHAAMSTLYVGHTAPPSISQNASAHTGCASPSFNSVQAAVDAAQPGDTVYLCSTIPYMEQVIITKSITLTGDKGATIQAPNPFPSTSPSRLPPQFTSDNLFVPQTVVFIWGSGVNTKVIGLNIAGVLPGNGGCAEQEFGVLVIDGATATLKGDQVKDIRDINSGLLGCQFGVAIQIGRRYWPTADFSNFLVENFVGHATITNTKVFGYEKNGITIDGPGSKANVSGSTVNGFGQTTVTAQNGIQFSRGASGEAMNNTVTDNAYTGTGGASSGGILIYGALCGGDPLVVGVEIEHNTLQNNDVGAFVSNLGVDSNNNCVLPSTPTNIQVSNNHISNNAVSNISGPNLLNNPGGYQAGISDEGYGDRLTGNKICGIGYTPVANPPPFLSMIDIIATNPVVKGNTSCSTNQDINTQAGTKTTVPNHNHALVKPIR